VLLCAAFFRSYYRIDLSCPNAVALEFSALLASTTLAYLLPPEGDKCQHTDTDTDTDTDTETDTDTDPDTDTETDTCTDTHTQAHKRAYWQVKFTHYDGNEYYGRKKK
jgi:hypothetical protein